MHKVYENNDLAMYFKKRYCHCCGEELQRKKCERIVRKGDPDHGTYCSIGTSYKPYGDIMVIGTEYWCPICDKTFSCDDQGKIIAAQKCFKRNIVSDEEVAWAENDKMSLACANIKKLRWLLFIPILGAIICQSYIFNGILSEKINSKDCSKLLLYSIMLLIAVALIIKAILNLFASFNFPNEYQRIIMLILSGLSFNLPTLLYINRTFSYM